jgi:beta-1,4-mannosyl-glycoprotein beta-1,4-N-acetylglucosaminyltransferase
MWLDIHLHTLVNVVEKFVIVEAAETFSGRPKPLYFNASKGMFKKFEDKIVHIIAPNTVTSNAWGRERFQRQLLFDEGLSRSGIQFDDVIILGDIDEIPKPKTVEALRNCKYPNETIILMSDFYYFSFQYRKKTDWGDPQTTTYLGKSPNAESLRRGKVWPKLNGAAWHCSYCFPSIKQFQNKLESFSHQEFNNARMKDPKRILRVVSEGIDMFERNGVQEMILIPNNTDIPDYLKGEGKEKYRFLVDRHNPTGGFEIEELESMGLRV